MRFWILLLPLGAVAFAPSAVIPTRRSHQLFSTAESAQSTTFTSTPNDDAYDFAVGPSVRYWTDYQPASTDGIENLRNAAAKAVGKASADPRAFQYWTYHLARATFFAGQGAAAVLNYRLTDSTSSSSSGLNVLDAPKNPITSGGPNVLLDFVGSIFPEAISTWEQDWEQINANKFSLPYDMRQGVTSRQLNPLYLADQTRRYIKEAQSILTRRNRRLESDIGAAPDPTDTFPYPAYYKNNFHFQSDGWFSEDSAKVYDSSTETLFLGRQDAMQRLALYPMATWAKDRGVKEGGEGLNILEVACGTGRLNAFVRDNYPAANMVASDLSNFYLAEAKGHAERWEKFARREKRGLQVGNFETLQCSAEELPFDDESQDVVINVYMFHEMPTEARRAAAKEMSRVVKPGGLLTWVDSVQKGDRPSMDETLGNFQYLNEPHYPSHIVEDVAALFVEAGLVPYEKHVASTSKGLSFVKPKVE